MSVEDKQHTRHLERELSRFQTLDITEARIAVTHGNAYISGVIRPGLGQFSLNIKNEMRVFTEIALKVPGIRSITIEARLETSPRK